MQKFNIKKEYNMSLVKENPSIISKNLTITGNLKSNGIIEIEGEILGDIEADNISIREDGKVVGNVKTKVFNIKGIFEGSAISEKINISEKAIVTGELEYCSLAVDYGANINCQLKRNNNGKNFIINTNKNENKEEIRTSLLFGKKKVEE